MESTVNALNLASIIVAFQARCCTLRGFTLKEEGFELAERSVGDADNVKGFESTIHTLDGS